MLRDKSHKRIHYFIGKQTLNAIVKRYLAGESISHISRVLKVSRNTVTRQLQQFERGKKPIEPHTIIKEFFKTMSPIKKKVDELVNAIDDNKVSETQDKAHALNTFARALETDSTAQLQYLLAKENELKIEKRKERERIKAESIEVKAIEDKSKDDSDKGGNDETQTQKED